MNLDRRTLLALLAATAAPLAPARAQDVSRSAFAFSFTGLDGQPIRLSEHAGKPILVVNTASLCGFTPQYRGLEEVWQRYKDRGLLIVGVPSNDFGGQEPGSDADINHTAHAHGVTFPVAHKAVIRGSSPHPFYRWAAAERPLEPPRWNFHKYLIGRDGKIVGSFPSAIEPNDPRILGAIEKQLAPAVVSQ
jgi:glutathione peroxidase